MLPKIYHPDDRKWLEDQFRKLPPEHRSRAAEGYSKTYSEALEREPAEHKKENAARFEANSRLRRYVNKILTAMWGD